MPSSIIYGNEIQSKDLDCKELIKVTKGSLKIFRFFRIMYRASKLEVKFSKESQKCFFQNSNGKSIFRADFVF